MDQPGLVRRRQRAGDVAANLKQLRQRQWSLCQPLCQRDTVNVLHDDERPRAGVLDGMNRHDARMVQGRRRARLAHE